MKWFKVWGPSLANHHKWIAMTLEQRGAWISMLTLASCLEPPWTAFRGRDHLTQLLTREGASDPLPLIDRFVELTLLDELADGGLAIHDIAVWQPKYPSDEPAATRERKRRSRLMHSEPTATEPEASRVVTSESRHRETEDTEETEETDGSGTHSLLSTRSLLDRLMDSGLNPQLAENFANIKRTDV